MMRFLPGVILCLSACAFPVAPDRILACGVETGVDAIRETSAQVNAVLADGSIQGPELLAALKAIAYRAGEAFVKCLLRDVVARPPLLKSGKLGAVDVQRRAAEALESW